ncbi:MAG: metal-dependent transcriptional regulator [Spirochaetaceae bacterium]|jgi:DtxR family Mn-dependent transcriptional regulator|nr:metal-dependent transcriptional regulator [Spirochaetaceae bacterium]
MTQSLEDYLEMVGFLSDEGEVRVTDIASRLGVSKPSVLTALKTLEDQGLLEHERYRSVTLTERGKEAAAKIRGRHDFLTSFLHDILGVSRDIAEQDACKMEHVLSEETLKRMKVLTLSQQKKAPKTRRKNSEAPAG